MLKQRVITALVLAPVVLAAVFLFPAEYFALFIGLVVLIASTEFVPLSGIKEHAWKLIAVLILIALLLSSHFFLASLSYAPILGAVLWMLIIFMLFIKSRQPVALLTEPSYFSLLFGIVLLWLCWLSLYLLMLSSDQGSWLVMYLLLIIWAADVGAYFSGKNFGKNKLAVNISPGKTLEGVAGGLASVVVLAMIAHQWILTAMPLMTLIVISIITAIVSVAGDLFESVLKRQRAMKDSGTILPGHGGVLDRTDSLIAASPVFYSLLWWIGN